MREPFTAIQILNSVSSDSSTSRILASYGGFLSNLVSEGNMFYSTSKFELCYVLWWELLYHVLFFNRGSYSIFIQQWKSMLSGSRWVSHSTLTLNSIWFFQYFTHMRHDWTFNFKTTFMSGWSLAFETSTWTAFTRNAVRGCPDSIPLTRHGSALSPIKLPWDRSQLG